MRKGNKEIILSGILVIVLLIILSGVFFFSKMKTRVGDDVTEPIMAAVIEIPKLNPFDLVQIEGKAALVKNLASGEVLFHKNENEVLPLASLTKLVTAVAAYEILKPETTVTLTVAELASEGDVSLLPGETFTVQELIDLTLTSSSNDGAAALAFKGEELLMAQNAQNASGSKEKFIDYMNILARKIGMENTSLFNETGLDESGFRAGAVGSAKDVSLLAEYILKQYPELFKATQKNNFETVSTQGIRHTIYNTNTILSSLPNVIGSKTGYTDMAGGNLMVIIDPALNTPIIITVLGSSKEGRFSDINKLSKATLDYFSEMTE